MKRHLTLISYSCFIVLVVVLTPSAFSQNPINQWFSNEIRKTNHLLEQYFFDNAKQNCKYPCPYFKYPEAPNLTDWKTTDHSPVSILKLSDKSGIRYRDILYVMDTIHLHDTLVIGVTPGEELIIDTIWIQNGPIIVIGDGILRFQNAHATILGNIFTFDQAQVIADSSYLYFPQEYFYQRTIFLSSNSFMSIHNSTLDFGGLVHNIAVFHSASLELINVEKPDFSTVGMGNKSSILIDVIDMAGEFIVTDSVELHIKNAATVLLWHHFGDGAEANISFPDGDTVYNYRFNNSSPEVNGIEYNIMIDTCTDVMWGMMPSNGSDLTISNSEIRTIGFWFEGNDSIHVNGLVNHNYYQDYTVPLNDRFFHLIDCNVMTWSLYVFDTVKVEVEGCILGEIGVMGQSSVNALNHFIDGSGGYLWAVDTTLLVSGMSSLTTSIRSSGNSIVILAYSAMLNGSAMALDNSVLMLIQSSIPEQPVFDEGSVVWMGNITGPLKGFVNSQVAIFGSAWIDKGELSNLMDFESYDVFFQKEPDTAWIQIGNTVYEEVRDDTLVTWNTGGLTPGAYILRLDLNDNIGNTAILHKSITLLPEVLSINDPAGNNIPLFLYPNPAKGNLMIEYKLKENDEIQLTVLDISGRELDKIFEGFSGSGNHTILFNTHKLENGIYICRLTTDTGVIYRKFIILR
jgi:hypothetical protein